MLLGNLVYIPLLPVGQVWRVSLGPMASHGSSCQLQFCSTPSFPREPHFPGVSIPKCPHPIEIPDLQKELLLPREITTQENILTFDHIVNEPH